MSTTPQGTESSKADRHEQYIQLRNRISRLLEDTPLPAAFDRTYYQGLGAVEVYTAEQMKAYAKSVLQVAARSEQ